MKLSIKKVASSQLNTLISLIIIICIYKQQRICKDPNYHVERILMEIVS